MSSSGNNYGGHSSQYEQAKIKFGKPVTERMTKRTPHIDYDDQLTRGRELKESSNKKLYEVIFSYDVLRNGVPDKGQSLTMFKHDKELTIGEVKEIAEKRIIENRFKDCCIRSLTFLNIHRRF